MATKFQGDLFERLAFEAAVSEHPGDVTAQLALIDYLQDRGFTPMGAKQRVARLVREAVEAQQVLRVKKIFETFPGCELDVINRLCRNGRFPFRPRPVLRIKPTFQPVSYSAIPGYFEDNHGNRYSNDQGSHLEFVPLRWHEPRAWIDISASLVLGMLEDLAPSRQRA